MNRVLMRTTPTIDNNGVDLWIANVVLTIRPSLTPRIFSSSPLSLVFSGGSTRGYSSFQQESAGFPIHNKLKILHESSRSKFYSNRRGPNSTRIGRRLHITGFPGYYQKLLEKPCRICMWVSQILAKVTLNCKSIREQSKISKIISPRIRIEAWAQPRGIDHTPSIFLFGANYGETTIRFPPPLRIYTLSLMALSGCVAAVAGVIMYAMSAKHDLAL